ncbi:MAG: NAD(+)/NADH kinase [Planctomycetota bacterium]
MTSSSAGNLQYPTPPRRFLLLGNGRKEQVVAHADEIRNVVESNGGTIAGFDLSGQTSMENHEADLAIVLGGDGAILRAAHQLGERQIPVLGINLGRLGFLAELTPDEFCSVCPEVLAGQFGVSRHVTLECAVGRIQNSHSPRKYRVLNEVVVSAGPPFQIIDIELTIDGEPVTTFSGDGLILSTPIGSTAHSLAAGGPILVQSLDAVVITPVCPHGLTWRPLVESSNREFQLRCPKASGGTTLIIDGHIQLPLTPNHQVVVRRSAVDFQLARLRGRSYYRTLTEKLHWGDRLAP